MPVFDIACNLMRQAVREDERCNHVNAIRLYNDALDRFDEALREEVRDWRYRPTLMARLQLYHNRYCELLDGLSSRSLGSPPPLPDDFLTYEPDSRSNSSSISSKASFSSLSDVSFSSDSSVPSPGVWEEGCSPHWVPLDDDPSIMIPAWLPASLPPWAPVNIWSFP